MTGYHLFLGPADCLQQDFFSILYSTKIKLILKKSIPLL